MDYTEGKNKQVIASVLVILFISAVAVLALKGTSLLKSLKEEDVAFISQADLDFQSKVKEITGNGWPAIIKADDSESAGVAALLFLANEIDALAGTYILVNRSVGLSKSELGAAKLDAADNSKENLLKMIKNMESIERAFSAKGLETAKTRKNRLSVIEKFFRKNPLPERQISPEETELFAETLGLSVNTPQKIVSLMIINYAFFVEEQESAAPS